MQNLHPIWRSGGFSLTAGDSEALSSLDYRQCLLKLMGFVSLVVLY